MAKTRDENPVMTFPIKKRIKTELFIDESAGLYVQKASLRSNREIEEGKLQYLEMRNYNGCLFFRNYLRGRECKALMSACYKMTLTEM